MGPARPSADGGTLLRVRVQPRASRNEIAGIRADSVKVRLTAPPVDGKANKALLRFLAKRLGVPPSSLGIRRGEGGRDKEVEVPGKTPEEVLAALGLV